MNKKSSPSDSRVTANKKAKKISKSIPEAGGSTGTSNEFAQRFSDLFDQGGLVELLYDLMERRRLKPNLTMEEREELAKHDALEERIQSEPENVMCEALKAFDDAVLTFMKLFRSKKLRQYVWRSDGTLDEEMDEAASLFFDRIGCLNRDIIKLAEMRLPDAESAIFFGAKTLSAAFIRLAQQRPEDFVSIARRSATMPSLRSRHPDYTADSAAIAERIHLGEDHPAPDIQDNRSRVAAHSHCLVAEIIEEIQSYRDTYQRYKETFEGFQTFSETAHKYRDMTLLEYLRSHLHPDWFNRYTVCAEPGELREDAATWWKKLVLPMVKEKFEELAKRPIINAGLWEELGRGGESMKDSLSDRRRYLEKLCKNKFHQIAATARRRHARGQRD